MIKVILFPYAPTVSEEGWQYNEDQMGTGKCCERISVTADSNQKSTVLQSRILMGKINNPLSGSAGASPDPI